MSSAPNVPHTIPPPYGSPATTAAGFRAHFLRRIEGIVSENLVERFSNKVPAAETLFVNRSTVTDLLSFVTKKISPSKWVFNRQSAGQGQRIPQSHTQ